MILPSVVYEHVVGSDIILQWWFCRWVVSNSCDPMDRGSWQATVHGNSQARILEWVAMPSSRVSSQPRDQTQVSLHCRQILHHPSYQGSPLLYSRETVYGRWESEISKCSSHFWMFRWEWNQYFITTKVPDHVYELKERKKRRIGLKTQKRKWKLMG